MNWIRRNPVWIACASVRTISVLARPGRPSRSTCPPIKSAMSSPSTASFWPTTRSCTAALTFSSSVDPAVTVAFPMRVSSILAFVRLPGAPRKTRYHRRYDGMAPGSAGTPSSQRRSRNSATVRPAWRMMARKVPRRSPSWSGTTKRRNGGSDWRRIMWLPCCRSSSYPIASSAFTTFPPESAGSRVDQTSTISSEMGGGIGSP